MGAPETTTEDAGTDLRESEPKHYVVWSPDGIPLRPEPALGVHGVMEQLYGLLKGIEHQGFYSNAQREHLTITEVLEQMRITEHDLVMSPTMAYTQYVQGLVPDINEGKPVGILSYAEFLVSETCAEMIDGDLQEDLPRQPSEVDDSWTLFGKVGVDAGMLMVCDPCYIGSEWMGEDETGPKLAPAHEHKDGTILYCTLHGEAPFPDAIGFDTYEQVVEKYGKTPNAMSRDGELSHKKRDRAHQGMFSYDGCCDASLNGHFGQLKYRRGHDGAGVVFGSGFGDGVYEVYGKIREFDDWGPRVAEVRIVMIDEEEDDDEATELIRQVAGMAETSMKAIDHLCEHTGTATEDWEDGPVKDIAYSKSSQFIHIESGHVAFVITDPEGYWDVSLEEGATGLLSAAEFLRKYDKRRKAIEE